MSTISHEEFNRRVKDYITALAEMRNVEQEMTMQVKDGVYSISRSQFKNYRKRTEWALTQLYELEAQIMNYDDEMPAYDDSEPDTILKHAGVFYRELYDEIKQGSDKTFQMLYSGQISHDQARDRMHHQLDKRKEPLREFGLCTNPEEALQITLRYKGA